MTVGQLRELIMHCDADLEVQADDDENFTFGIDGVIENKRDSRLTLAGTNHFLFDKAAKP